MDSFIDWLHALDQQITLLINNIHCITSDSLMVFMSDRAVWFPLYAIVAGFLFVRLGWKKGLVAIVCIFLAFGACDQASNLLKYSVGRLRPCYSYEMVTGGLHFLENRGNFFGFFSAHAANAFGFAMSTSLLFKYDKAHKYRPYTILIFSWAALLSLSRIFVGKHYLGDILVGASIGCIFGYLAAIAGRYVFSLIDKNTIVR